MSFSFPRQYRLKRSADIGKVFRSGQKYVGQYHNLFVLPRSELKLAIITPKRIGNAVKRNTAKRRVREVCRQNPENLLKGYQVFFVKKMPPTFFDTKRDILSLLKKANSQTG